MTITLRQTKGSALTHAELDANFIDLSGQLDGIAWESQTNPVDNNWNEVAYGNGLFVAVTHTGTGNRVMTSPDGVNWTIRSSAADANWTGLAYGDGVFVAVASSGGTRVMTSYDGITWTLRSPPVSSQWSSITYGNGLFVAVGTQQTGNDSMTSPDGITWTAQTNPVQAWGGVTYGNGLFVAVGITGTGNRVMTSPDGVTWTNRTSAADNTWRSVCYGNGIFVAVADQGTLDRVMSSPDAITWTLRTAPNTTTAWQGVDYGNGVYVAVGQDPIGAGTANVMTSTDGIVWTIRAGAAPNTWADVIYGNGMFVAVSATGTGDRVMTSGFINKKITEDTHRINGELLVSENVGIGTPNPVYSLHVDSATANGDVSPAIICTQLGAGAGTGTSIQLGFNELGGRYAEISGFYDGAGTILTFASSPDLSTSPIEAMRINRTGDVGIGTTLPDGTLHVKTADAGTLTANTLANDLVVENNASGGISVLTPAGQPGHLMFGRVGNNNAGGITLGTTGIEVGPQIAGTELTLLYGPGSVGMTLDSAGNVGIGIATPDGKLHVWDSNAGTVTASAAANLIVAERNTNGGMSVLTADASTSRYVLGSVSNNIGGQLTWNYNASQLNLATGIAAGFITFGASTGAEDMRITAAGDVGIGTTLPDGTLHVHTATAGTLTANTLADDLVVENNTAGGISVLTPAGQPGHLMFGQVGNNRAGGISLVTGGIEVGPQIAGTELYLLYGAGSVGITLDSAGGAFMTGATGGSQGAGTFNAQAVYDDGVLLTCYVPHYIVDGGISLNEWDDLVPNKKDEKTFHLPARRFALDVHNRIEVEKFTDFWKTNKHLPTMPSKEEWVKDGPKPTGEMIQMLWETVELQAAHIDQLLTRIEALEGAK